MEDYDELMQELEEEFWFINDHWDDYMDYCGSGGDPDKYVQ